MSLISAGSISLDSTFNPMKVNCLELENCLVIFEIFKMVLNNILLIGIYTF
jgi:hypothetical protein